jgi:Na+/proline symporter
MDPWTCASLILTAGALGGVVNALITHNGFVLPQIHTGIWCPGFVANVLVGAFAAFASWSFYGSGAGVEVAARVADGAERAIISLTFSALAGAFLVGVAGAKWITNEVDKKLLKESVKVAGPKKLSPEVCEKLVAGSPLQILQRVEQA